MTYPWECPKCGHGWYEVHGTNDAMSPPTIRRYRVCNNSKCRYSEEIPKKQSSDVNCLDIRRIVAAEFDALASDVDVEESRPSRLDCRTFIVRVAINPQREVTD